VHDQPVPAEWVVAVGAASDISALLAEGTGVVLVDADAGALSRAAGRGGAGARLALFVGDPGQDGVMAAARAMAAELLAAR